MIPILYGANETSFTSNGIGRLSDAISCKVIEERNSIYELEMQYHIDGAHYSDITEDRLILAKPFDGGTNQAFRIYKITRPLNGVVTVYAEHISYLLNRMGVKPFTAGSCVEAFARIESNFVTTCPFTFWTDKSVTANMNVVEPHAARELLGGMQGSILDTYGKGDYEFDNFLVKFHSNRGSNNGVSFHYGKNITELSDENDIQNAYTGVVPYWKDSEDNVTMLPEYVVWSSHRNDYLYPLIKIVDFSTDFDNQPTEAQLRSKANSYISQNSGWNPSNNIKISFVALWQTEEYQNVANLERVRMCDTVKVVYDKLGVNVNMRVVKTDYDVLAERYNSIEVGDASTNLAKAVAESDKTIADNAQEITSEYKKAVAHATKMIQGGLGGHIVFNTDAQGHPNELLIMDTDDRLTATNVWRFNLGGLGFSSDGYDGPFDKIALTADGKINATRIITGEMSADRVRGGTLESQNRNLIFNLNTGKMTVSGSEGLTISSAHGLIISAGNFQIDASGNITVAGNNNQLGPWKLTNSSIYKGDSNSYNTEGVMYFGNSGISLSDKFRVSSAGALVASNVTITGGTLRLGDKTSLTDANNGFYLSSSGMALGPSNAFKVTSAGALTAKDVSITGGTFKLNKTSLTDSRNGFYVGDDGLALGASSSFVVSDQGNVSIKRGTISLGGKTSIAASDTSNGFYVTQDGMALGASGAFIVSNQGNVTMKRGTISLGGKTSISASDTSNGFYVTQNGMALGASGAFIVTSAGKLTATNAEITGKVTANTGYFGGTSGFTIESKKIYNGKTTFGSSTNGFFLSVDDGMALGANGAFKVTPAGKLTATNADIKGEIKADTGKIGGNNGFTIDTNKIYKGKSSFESRTAGIYIGAGTGDNDGISIGDFNGGASGTGFRAAESGKVQVGCLYFFRSGTNIAQYGLWAKSNIHIGSGGPCDFNSEWSSSNNNTNYLRGHTQIGFLTTGSTTMTGNLEFSGGNYNISGVDGITGSGTISMSQGNFEGSGVKTKGLNMLSTRIINSPDISDLWDAIGGLSTRISNLGG